MIPNHDFTRIWLNSKAHLFVYFSLREKKLHMNPILHNYIIRHYRKKYYYIIRLWTRDHARSASSSSSSSTSVMGSNWLLPATLISPRSDVPTFLKLNIGHSSLSIVDIIRGKFLNLSVLNDVVSVETPGTQLPQKLHRRRKITAAALRSYRLGIEITTRTHGFTTQRVRNRVLWIYTSRSRRSFSHRDLESQAFSYTTN